MHNLNTNPDSGPFRADQIRDGAPYELSNGHLIYCPPDDPKHIRAVRSAVGIFSSDPEVKWAGIDAGFTPQPDILRATDIAVTNSANTSDMSDWILGAPTLAVEYVSLGQDETELQAKITDLLQFGTKYVWVVRLTGMRRVEVYEPNKPMRRVLSGENLTAPGVLRNPVPVNALYDRDAAHEVTLRNLLQRQGYASLDAIRIEGEAKGKVEGEVKGKAEGKAEGEIKGKAKGKAEAILAVLASRGLAISAPERLQILGCISEEILQSWLMRVSHISVTAELFG